jgi:hypothetical protein
MELVLCRNLWGLQDDPSRYHEALPEVAAAGYDAVACPVQLLPEGDRFAEALAASGLEYLPQLFTFGTTVADHVAMFRDGLARAATFDPRYVLTQAGLDAWDHDTALGFFAELLSIEFDLGTPVVHETHRGRYLFTPWNTVRLLDELSELRVSCDLSHWTCVTESIRLDDAWIAAVAGRARHIDARVGWEEGPQVPDPSAERFAGHLAAFESWWDTIWAAQDAAGTTSLSITPEYGPPPYLPLDPHTGEPAVPLAETVAWAAARVRDRYGSQSEEAS